MVIDDLLANIYSKYAEFHLDDEILIKKFYSWSIDKTNTDSKSENEVKITYSNNSQVNKTGRSKYAKLE